MGFPAPGRIGRPLRASASEGIDTMLAGLTALLVACSFHFNDRGRGPELDATVRLGDHGRPVHLEVSGVDYLKSSVQVRFSAFQDDGEPVRARWENVPEGMEARYRASFDRMLYEAIGVAP